MKPRLIRIGLEDRSEIQKNYKIIMLTTGVKLSH